MKDSTEGVTEEVPYNDRKKCGHGEFKFIRITIRFGAQAIQFS